MRSAVQTPLVVETFLFVSAHAVDFTVNERIHWVPAYLMVRAKSPHLADVVEPKSADPSVHLVGRCTCGQPLFPQSKQVTDVMDVSRKFRSNSVTIEKKTGNKLFLATCLNLQNNCL